MSALSPADRRLLSARQASNYLAVSERTLWSLSAAGQIAKIKLGRAVRYDVRDLDAYIASHRVGGSA